jgi:hypothetical protein
MNQEQKSELKSVFGDIKSITNRNRDGKHYLTISLYGYSKNGYSRLLTIKGYLRGFFPDIYITSGGNSSMTFRLN